MGWSTSNISYPLQPYGGSHWEPGEGIGDGNAACASGYWIVHIGAPYMFISGYVSDGGGYSFTFNKPNDSQFGYSLVIQLGTRTLFSLGSSQLNYQPYTTSTSGTISKADFESGRLRIHGSCTAQENCVNSIDITDYVNFNVTATFNPAGGTWSDGSTANKTKEVPYGDAPKTPPYDVTMEYHTLRGWNPVLSTPITSNTTYTAQWALYRGNLVVDPNGGTYEGSKKAVTYSGDRGATVNISRNVEGPSVKVTFNGNGGSPSTNSKSGNLPHYRWDLVGVPDIQGAFNEKTNVYTFLTTVDGHTEMLSAVYAPLIITLPKCTRSGYVFAGWFTADGHNVGGAEQEYEVTQSLTLYAHWVTTPVWKYDEKANKWERFIPSGTTAANVDYVWKRVNGAWVRSAKIYKYNGTSKSWVQLKGS